MFSSCSHVMKSFTSSMKLDSILFLIIVSLLASFGECEYNPVYRQYVPESSDFIKSCKSSSSKVMVENYVKLFTDGVSPTVWNSAIELLRNSTTDHEHHHQILSNQCSNALMQIFRGLTQGRLWAFKCESCVYVCSQCVQVRISTEAINFS